MFFALVIRWDLEFVKCETTRGVYNNVAKDISHAFEFMASCTKTPARLEGANKLFTSHEGLVLEYVNPHVACVHWNMFIVDVSASNAMLAWCQSVGLSSMLRFDYGIHDCFHFTLT